MKTKSYRKGSGLKRGIYCPFFYGEKEGMQMYERWERMKMQDYSSSKRLSRGAYWHFRRIPYRKK